MYLSQLYVVVSQLAQTQKQMLTAQVMTNTLLVATSLSSENMLQTMASKTR
jgi:hypothetical protein